MSIKLSNLTLKPHQKESELFALCAKKLRAPCKQMRIVKKSLDARDKRDIKWVYSVECFDNEELPPAKVYQKITRPAPKVYVVGMGPAGLFCAVALLRHGFSPILLERGKRVEERASDVVTFQATGVLNTESNVQFGEGGAGTFSDGKLNTQTNSPLNREVLELFVEFGAPQEILYLSKPHIGSDKLRTVIQNMREYLLQNGGEIRFQTKVEDIRITDGRISHLLINGAWGEAQEVVLAVGHSARDTFETLYSRGVKMEQKEFAVGVRIEHLQEQISYAQYGAQFTNLPPADYKLTSHASERAVFTFCMCPGGVVVPATSEEGGVVVNGMSNYARDEKNANSALVVQVKKEDFASDSPLAGIAFQRELEKKAFAAGGGGYRAPVQLVGDFLRDRDSSRFQGVLPSYARGVNFAPIKEIFPAQLTEALKRALPDMDRRLKGFASPEGVLTGVESRTSSPLRILRGEDMQAVGIQGLYPCGEGCGYAGGITSAAADGLRVASALFFKYE